MGREPQRIKPHGNGWELIGIYPEYTAYQRDGFCALSSTCFIQDEHLPPHWEWLVSFSNRGQNRLNNSEIKECLADFGLSEFVEDNHERGIARKFWKAVQKEYRQPCPCKDELVITEGDYQYSVKKSNPASGRLPK